MIKVVMKKKTNNWGTNNWGDKMVQKIRRDRMNSSKRKSVDDKNSKLDTSPISLPLYHRSSAVV